MEATRRKTTTNLDRNHCICAICGEVMHIGGCISNKCLTAHAEAMVEYHKNQVKEYQRKLEIFKEESVKNQKAKRMEYGSQN